MSTRTWLTALALMAGLVWASLYGVLVLRDLEIGPTPGAPDLP